MGSRNRLFAGLAKRSRADGGVSTLSVSDSTGESMVLHPDGTIVQTDEDGNVTTETMVSKEESTALAIALG